MKQATHPPRTYIYQLRFKGQLEDDFLPSYCPPQTVLQCQGDTALLSNVCTDQSGIIGLIRRLHNLGCTIFEITAQQAD